MHRKTSAHALPEGRELAGRLFGLVDACAGRRILILGDVIADEFIYGQISRVSREAPVLILRYDSTEVVPGGAGNAANNVAALGGRAVLAGVVGRDEAGRRMLRAMHRNVERDALVRPAGYGTPTKTRILAGGVHSAKQQVVRIDREAVWRDASRAFEEVEKRALAALSRCDGVLVSDYGLGLVDRDRVGKLTAAIGRQADRFSVPVLIDSRHQLLQHRKLTACTPNESEVEQMLDVKVNDDVGTLERAGREVLRRTGHRAVLVTRGSRGMSLFEPSRPTVHIPIFGTDEIADVTGAGDTVIATMTLALAAGASFYEAARLANYAGGLVVMKRGTATVSAEELRQAIAADHGAAVT
jgi:D-glycero-beta-D-manno-heptose-7-phosphate kinase